jgi:hypothetical protein
MKFTTTSAGVQPTVASPNADTPRRWSDIVAGRESTHPCTTPFGRIVLTTELLEQVLLQLPPLPASVSANAQSHQDIANVADEIMLTLSLIRQD